MGGRSKNCGELREEAEVMGSWDSDCREVGVGGAGGWGGRRTSGRKSAGGETKGAP